MCGDKPDKTRVINGDDVRPSVYAYITIISSYSAYRSTLFINRLPLIINCTYYIETNFSNDVGVSADVGVSVKVVKVIKYNAERKKKLTLIRRQTSLMVQQNDWIMI